MAIEDTINSYEYKLKQAGVAVATSRNATAADLETIVNVTAAATLTIPSDATLGITDVNYRCKITTYQTTAGAVAIVGSGATLRNTQPTADQRQY